MKLRFIPLNILLFSISILFSNINAQSLNSLTGLFNIPTADMMKDGEVTVGVFELPHYYLQNKNFDKNGIEYFAAIGFLPFAEGSLRFTRNYAETDALGDRMFSLKIRGLQESEYLPSVSIGAQDLFHSTENRTNRFNSLYIAAAKNIRTTGIVKNISLNLGYGTDLIEAGGYQYIGLFGGISITVLNYIEFMAEYDTKDFNGGMRINLFGHFKILVGLLSYQYFAGGASINFNL